MPRKRNKSGDLQKAPSAANDLSSTKGQLLFAEKISLPRELEIKIQKFNNLLENEIENENNSKNITKITDALIMLDTLMQIIQKQPYQKWCVEARKILSGMDDSRAKTLADEIDNAIPTASSNSISPKK